jgi:hypothetical protein
VKFDLPVSEEYRAVSEEGEALIVTIWNKWDSVACNSGATDDGIFLHSDT